MTLSPDAIEMKLDQLEKNQQDLREGYTRKFEELGAKIDKLAEKIDNLPTQFVTRGEFEYCKDKVKSMEENRKKIIWIILTAVIGAVLSLVLIHN